MLSLLRDILVKLVKPTVLVSVAGEDLLGLDIDSVDNQLDDEDLLINQELHDEIQKAVEEGDLAPNQRDRFYK